MMLFSFVLVSCSNQQAPEHSLILKENTLYNNQIKSLDEYIHLVEDWIIFYNTKRLKNRKPKPPIN